MTETISHEKLQVLKRVVSDLRAHDIEFQLTGGLAAIIYGAKRTLADIDIDVHAKDREKIKQLFQSYITENWNNDLEGSDDQFDCWLLQLDIDGVLVDISQVEEFKIKTKEGIWLDQPSELNYQMVTFVDMTLPVQKKEDLIAYKKILSRDVDVEDIVQIT